MTLYHVRGCNLRVICISDFVTPGVVGRVRKRPQKLRLNVILQLKLLQTAQRAHARRYEAPARLKSFTQAPVWTFARGGHLSSVHPASYLDEIGKVHGPH